jgi:CRISPR system Cascade subunit CasB
MFYHVIRSTEDIKTLTAWWHWLNENRGQRALLRRAETAEDVLLTTAFAHFLKFMPAGWGAPTRLFDSALVAGLLARATEHTPKISLAQALASPKQGGTKAAMSELRFQQLQKSRDPDEFFRRLSRAIALLGGRVNIISLADGILHWQQEYRHCVDKLPTNRLAVRWATDYYTTLKD